MPNRLSAVKDASPSGIVLAVLAERRDDFWLEYECQKARREDYHALGETDLALRAAIRSSAALADFYAASDEIAALTRRDGNGR